VVGKDLAHNVLLVAQGADHPWLYQHCIATEPATWITEPLAADFTCTAQVRYRQHPAPCRVQVHADGSLMVDFEQPQWAATPGQSLVLYEGEECLGGAVIQQAVDRANPSCQLAG
jgi:tRNA-specific 2-thiouridylase